MIVENDVGNVSARLEIYEFIEPSAQTVSARRLPEFLGLSLMSAQV